MPHEARMIIAYGMKGHYEAVLGVAHDASSKAIHRAHIMLLHRFRAFPDVVLCINNAKAAITGESYIEKGRRLSRIGKMEEALPYIRMAVERQGKAADYRWLGNTLSRLKRYEEALPCFKKALEIPSPPNLEGCCAPRTAAPEQFEEVLTHALRRQQQQSDAIVHHWLGSSLVELGRPNEALTHFERAARLRDDAFNNYWLGSLLLHMLRCEEALPRLERSVALRGDVLDRELLADCLTMLKQKRARIFWSGVKVKIPEPNAKIALPVLVAVIVLCGLFIIGEAPAAGIIFILAFLVITDVTGVVGRGFSTRGGAGRPKQRPL
ncbi:MAG: tetratricopeptide repeat protein [Pseudomonadota bacterium]